MKTVFLLRHAKSDWSDPSLDDFDRPLNKRGQEAAPKMADFMAEHGFKPDLALVSTAKRTMETWAAVQGAFANPPPADERISLYLAGVPVLLSALRGLDDKIDRVLMIGHNPGLQDFVLALAGSIQTKDGRSHLKRVAAKFPTGGLAVLTFDVDHWPDLQPGTGNLLGFFSPREL